MKEYYFVLNVPEYSDYTCIFKCGSEIQRRLFIDAIIETIYFKKTNHLHKLHTFDCQHSNNKYTYKYQPMPYYIKYNKTELNNLINDKQWFHVPVYFQLNDTKFLLSIKRESLMGFEFKISHQDLLDIAANMMDDYFNNDDNRKNTRKHVHKKSNFQDLVLLTKLVKLKSPQMD